MPFFPGYAREDQALGALALPPATITDLVDAGLPSLRALAQAPSAQVQSLGERHHADLASLRKVLAAEHERAAERARPTTLEGFLEAVLPARKGKGERHLVRALFGLDPPFEGRLDVTVRELSEAEKKTPRPSTWRSAGPATAGPSRARLREQVLRARRARRRGPARRARGRARARPAVRGRPRRRAGPGARRGARAGGDRGRQGSARGRASCACTTAIRGCSSPTITPVWCGSSATRPTSWPAGRRWLRRARRGGAWARWWPACARVLKEERLFEIGAAASERAACSARLEIYPRGLSAQRAVELCAATFKGGVAESEVRARVAARYPEAEPLPPRPALDDLLRVIGFGWNVAAAAYQRERGAAH
ncbi:MAG: hypothetical protein U0359_09395 [Byssovorax sp.]